jgi:hypothetical protein
MTKVTISLPDDLHQALEEESDRLGRSIESLIEERLTSSGPSPSARVAHLVEKARQSSGLDERRALATAVSETRAHRRES